MPRISLFVRLILNPSPKGEGKRYETQFQINFWKREGRQIFQSGKINQEILATKKFLPDFVLIDRVCPS
jgi:hypothetical protein